METVKVKDLLWIWGMKVNALQEATSYKDLPFGRSSITVEQVVQKTGITNVYVAGHLPLTKETLQSIPSATRLVCKTSAHGHDEQDRPISGMPEALISLDRVKKLALEDRRIDAFSLDDFSTGSLTAGVTIQDMTNMCFRNALTFPTIPLHATIYPMSLEKKELQGFLTYFDQLVLPMWFADNIDRSEEYIDRLNVISGNKPVLFALYVYDFGKNKMVTRKEMQKQLDVAEALLHQGKITGIMLIGTCLFDIGWEAVDCMYEWIDRVKEDRVTRG